MMRQFKTIFKMNFIKEMQYRVAAFSGIITQLFFGLMFIMIYMAFYETNASPDNFTLSQMSTYIWLQQAFFAIFHYYDSHKEISRQIISGDIAYKLIKPVSMYNHWFMEFLTADYSKVALRALGILIICPLLPVIGLTAPVSLEAFLLFAVSIVLGSVLIVSINMFSYILVLLTLSPGGVFGIVTSIASLLAGSIIPIPLMPEAFVKVLNFFPFRYVSDLPFRIYIGNISTSEGLVQIAIQIVWITTLIFLGKVAMHKVQKKIVVQGG